MFERYDVNDLFLASITVTYPNDSMYDTNIGGILMDGIVGYGYITVLKKSGENYIDLKNPSRKITTKRNPNIISNTIDYIEPLNKYYTQDGKKKNILSKRKTLNLAEKYCVAFDLTRLARLKKTDKEKVKTL